MLILNRVARTLAQIAEAKKDGLAKINAKAIIITAYLQNSAKISG
jgi:hypothetical protein